MKNLFRRNMSGFTLIELLVVVLIIGILSSVALPQYTKAVEKSRAAEAMVFLRHLKDMGTMYMLENGDYTNYVTFSDLGVELPSGYSLVSDENGGIACNKYWCFMTNSDMWGDSPVVYPDSPMARRYKNGDPSADENLFYSLEYISQRVPSGYKDSDRQGSILCTDDQAKWCSMFGTTSGNPIK